MEINFSMYRKLIKYGMCFFTSTFLYSCDPGDGKLILINNSDNTVYYSVELCEDSIKVFPITYKEDRIDTLFSSMIEPKEEQPVAAAMNKWEYFINKCKDSTLRIFFFSEDLIKTAGKDSILRNQLYSKKEKLKVKDLEKLDWRVIYP